MGLGVFGDEVDVTAVILAPLSRCDVAGLARCGCACPPVIHGVLERLKVVNELADSHSAGGGGQHSGGGARVSDVRPLWVSHGCRRSAGPGTVLFGSSCHHVSPCS